MARPARIIWPRQKKCDIVSHRSPGIFLLDGKAGYSDAVDCSFFMADPTAAPNGAGFGACLAAIRSFQRDHQRIGPVTAAAAS
jgi:hypothetical protein